MRTRKASADDDEHANCVRNARDLGQPQTRRVRGCYYCGDTSRYFRRFFRTAAAVLRPPNPVSAANGVFERRTVAARARSYQKLVPVWQAP